jgi:hypothetical protein
MKLFISLVCSLVFTGSLMAGTPNVSIQVRVGTENQTTDRKAVDETRARWLTVRVTNSSAENLEGLELQWTLYADDLKRGTDDVVEEKSGTERFSVAASGRYTDVTTPKVQFTWTPQHSERTGSSRRASYKRVPESGRRYHGYAVKVIKDGAVIGELFSDPALRKME